MAQAATTLGAARVGPRLAFRYKRLTVFLAMAFLVGAYTSFLTADIYSFYLERSGVKHELGSIYSQDLKFVCILLCFTLTLLIGRNGHDRRDRTLLQIALGFTVVADFLIGICGLLEWGIAVFFLVQLAFIARHARGFVLNKKGFVLNKKEIASFVLIFGAVGGVFLQLLPLLDKDLKLWGSLYVLVLATSVWIGVGTLWRSFYPRTLDWFIAIGIVSFFLCDLNVGLNAGLAASPTPGLAKALVDWRIGRAAIGASDQHQWALVFGIFIWYWYLPAQTLLSLSGYRLRSLRAIFPEIPDLPKPEEG